MELRRGDVRRDRRRSRRHPAQLRGRCGTLVAPAAADGGGQGRRLRPRADPLRPGAPARPACPGSASPPWTRACCCASTATPAGSWPGSTCPGRCGTTRPSRHDIDMTAYSRRELAEIAAGAAVGGPARAGAAEGGHRPVRGAAARMPDWPALVAEARRLEVEGHLRVTGVWSHFACSDEPEHPANDAQHAAFVEALATGRGRRARRPRCGTWPTPPPPCCGPPPASTWSGSGCSATAWTRRPGCCPTSGLVPAMTVQTPLAMAKADPRGRGRVLRAHLGRRPRRPRVGLVPVGYAEGVPRARQLPRRGVGRRTAPPGARPDLHGPVRGRPRAATCPTPASRWCCSARATRGEPTAQDWAVACDTINYEIVTRIGGRLQPALRRGGARG